MISVNRSFQYILEVAVYLFAGLGLRRAGDAESFDKEAGKHLARLMLDNHREDFSPLILGRFVERYCSSDMLDSYLFALRIEGLEIADNPAWETIDVAMDIEAAAMEGKLHGWRKEWCPFAGEAERAWNNGFAAS